MIKFKSSKILKRFDYLNHGSVLLRSQVLDFQNVAIDAEEVEKFIAVHLILGEAVDLNVEIFWIFF